MTASLFLASPYAHQSVVYAAGAEKSEVKAVIQEVKWDSRSLIIGGKRVVPVMGEVHYSRIPAEEWKTEVRKMKDGGVTVIAAYVFWNHVEEMEGVYNWSGQRNLRRFLEICKEENMPVVLRLGPFCHGEVRNGGIPDWMFAKGCKMREENKIFMHYCKQLYRQIFSQVQGLQWKDGGPVMAAQFDNEYRGRGSYLMALKRIALNAGFDLPFYTRTGWPELRTPVPYGEMIPLYGDYADGFWERSIKETAGNYYKAFNFKAFRSSTAIASEQLGVQKEKLNKGDEEYPYFTCELGGGMMTSYHRRVYLYPEDAYSMALVKLGSGSNLLGYYMYHGGTNPEGFQRGSNDDGSLIYLNENQKTLATNYNDLPVKTYDFQAPLGEFGQINPHYYMLRKIHLFMHDYAETLAPMDAVFPCEQDIPKGDDTHLRWAYRVEGNSAFVFVNNYERLQNLTAKKNVRFDVCGVRFPQRPITVPAGAMCIFPVNIDGIRYATAQIIAKREGKIYLEQIKGVPTEICVEEGGRQKVLKNVKAKGTEKPVYGNIYLVDSQTAERLFLSGTSSDKATEDVPTPIVTKMSNAGVPRKITVGVQKVAEEPVDADFKAAAVYTIDNLPMKEREDRILTINYRGDCARLYAGGKLVADNFYNGRPFLFGLWRLPEDCGKLELRILPLQKDMPVYFPREADVKEPGEEVKSVVIE
ncbi:beta-galactosidase [Prevotella sp. PMUR]|uniref:Beta-galactosidase n=2 Tax=Xylanibacter muris TaxID=2736290 RepID=A0ABX2AJJ3_9BACT|nr:beta-galactosidase [Xylanibacter muris]